MPIPTRLPKERTRVYIESFGCPTNLADGEVIAGCLEGAGYTIAQIPTEADIMIYNTCAVKTPTENRMVDRLKRVPRGKKVIVAGCLPLINLKRLRREVAPDGIIGPAPGPEIVEAVERVQRGERVFVLRTDSKPLLSLPRVVSSRVVRIIPIAYGCRGDCSFCCVRFARGPLRSYGVDEVVGEVRRALGEGVREFWLTAQDSGSYGKDIGVDLVRLLRGVAGVEGDFFVRVGMMNPEHALGMLDELIEAYKDEKVFKFLHLPVQSGDDGVLSLMNRHYSVSDFKRIVQSFRREIPRVTVATDFICGFPGEDDEAFERSLSLIEEVKPDVVNVSKFSPRPGTLAKTMGRLPGRLVKERSRRMVELCRKTSSERNRSWLGWVGDVLIDEEGKDGSWVGRNFAYKPIVIRSKENLLGKLLRTRVDGFRPTYLLGMIIQTSLFARGIRDLNTQYSL